MTTSPPPTFFELRFHTNRIEVSPKAILALGEKEVYQAAERHFQADWGLTDEADQVRNETSLKQCAGIIVSRFASPSPGVILNLESDLNGNWTYVSLLGEES